MSSLVSKLIVYKFTIDDFDPFDFYDFSGNRIIENDFSVDMKLPDTISDKEIDDLIDEINERRSKLKEQFAEHPIVQALPEFYMLLDKKNPVLREYCYQYLLDQKLYNVVGGGNLNWKNLDKTGHLEKLSQPYKKYLSQKIDYFSKNILNKQLYDLVKNNLVQEVDLTDAVVSIGSHQTSCEEFVNNISFTLSVPAIQNTPLKYLTENCVVDFYVDFYDPFVENPFYPNKFMYGAYIGPSTISELEQFINLKQINQTTVHTRRFIGMITNIEYSYSVGSVPTCTISCEGIYSYLNRQNIVKNRAIVTFFEKYPFDLKQPGVTVFLDNLNHLSVNDIFGYILYHVLDLYPFDCGNQSERLIPWEPGTNKKVYKESDDLVKFLLLDSRLAEVSGLTYSQNDGSGLTIFRRLAQEVFSDFTSWSLLSTLYMKVKEKYSPQLEQMDDNPLPPEYYRGANIVGISEGNEYCVRAYNIQVKQSHTIFFNQFSSGTDILRNAANFSYYDIFEDKPGVLVCRPSRVNQVLIDSVDPKLFIIDPKDILSFSCHRENKSLSSRVDYTPTIPLKGELNPKFCLNYVDPQILYKYGLNIRDGQPVSNPNVVFYNFMPFFAAVALVQRNAMSRSLSLSVPAYKEYCLGRVYFIPDMTAPPNVIEEWKSAENPIGMYGWVGRLVRMSTSYSVGSIPTTTLEFVMARRGKIIEGTISNE